MARHYSILPSFLRRRSISDQSNVLIKVDEASWRTVYLYKRLPYVLMSKMGLIGLFSYQTTGLLYYTDHLLFSECLWVLTMIFFTKNAIKSRLGTSDLWRVDFSESTGQVKMFHCFKKKQTMVFLQELDVEEVQLGCRFRYIPRGRFYYLPNIPSTKAGLRETDTETIARWIAKCKMCKPFSHLSFFT